MGKTLLDATCAYDEVGNRTSKVYDGVTITYTYDDNDKLLSASDGSHSATFGYDGCGNMTSIAGDLVGDWSAVYDDEGRMIQLTYPSEGGSVTVSAEYDAQGHRVREVVPGNAFRSVFLGDRVLVQTPDDGVGVLAHHFITGGSYYSPWQGFRWGDANLYPAYDGVGTARRLVDESGGIAARYDLDAFGVPLVVESSEYYRYRFGGAWGYVTDPSGLLQLGARFYSPQIGRFLQQDPIRSGINWYAYVGNNPVVYIDPEGFGIMDPLRGPLDALGALIGDAIWPDQSDPHPCASGTTQPGGWELGGEVFAGIGAGFYFGVDPSTGSFVKAKAGVGLGFGGGWLPDFDPSARSRGAEAGFTGHGSFFGFDVGASAEALGRSVGSIGMAGGWASDPQGNLGRYPRKPRGPGPVPSYVTPPGKFGGTYTAKAGVTAVLEGGFY